MKTKIKKQEEENRRIEEVRKIQKQEEKQRHQEEKERNKKTRYMFVFT